MQEEASSQTVSDLYPGPHPDTPLVTMQLLSWTLCLCLAAALCHAAPHHGGDHSHDAPQADEPAADDHHLDRCHDVAFEAVTVDNEGHPLFFKDEYLWKGFHGKHEKANDTFHDLDEHHHLDHVDAAISLPHTGEDGAPDGHHTWLFLHDQVFQYDGLDLVKGFPKPMSEVFPGVPGDVDAAVECPKPDCEHDSVIFFKGDTEWDFHLDTKEVHEEHWKDLPKCTAAFRLYDHYYCFHGHHFDKFNPRNGTVDTKYQNKEIHDFFAECPDYGNGTDHVERERCSRVTLDGIVSDDTGKKVLAFRGHHYLYKNDTHFEAGTIESIFKEVHGEVDTVFSYDHHLYLIKDDKVYAYTVDEPHQLVEGYPKAVKDDLGVEGHIDAAFHCGGEDDHVHIIKDDHIYDVDMKASPRAATNDRPLSLFKHVDDAMCGPAGVTLVKGNHYYQWDSTMLMIAGRALPEQHRVSQDLFGCDH